MQISPHHSAPRTPALIWAGLLAFALTVALGGIWTVLLAANLALSPTIPWAVAVMAGLLWLMWWYLGGHWGPRRTVAARRRALRATRVPVPVFIWALVAGLLAIVSLAGLWFVLFDLAHLPLRTLPDYSRYPAATVILALVMASLVSALAEEAGFRGYFQGMLERRVGAIGAILIMAVVIAPGHALTQGFVWPTLLFYLCVDVVFGAMAYLTQSIIPGAIVHAIGLLIFFTLVWSGDALQRLFASTGWFWLHTAQAIVFAALAALAFGQLARIGRRATAAPTPTLAGAS